MELTELFDLAVGAQQRANGLGSGPDAKFIVILRRKRPVKSDRVRLAGPGSPVGQAHWSDTHPEGGWKTCASFSSTEVLGWLAKVVGFIPEEKEVQNAQQQ
jgi:hypothetical protein